MAQTPQLLANKVAIVTGASSDIGKAIATKFVNHGAIVILADKTLGSLETFAKDLNDTKESEATTGKAIAMECDDVSDWTSFSIAIRNVKIDHTNLDIFYYHEGFINRTMDANNVRSTLDLIDHVGEVMSSNSPKKGGCILLRSSTMGLLDEVVPSNSAYSISQTAATGVIRAKAAELARRNVRVNAISQGSNDWRMLVSIFPRAEEAQLKQMSKDCMMAKPEPGDMADVAVFLASRYGRSVTGHNLLLSKL